MLQAHYPKLDIRHIAEANPKGPGDVKILPDNYFDAVMECADMSQTYL